jgi:5-methylcytosine-specific restriction endonuclease McrA
VGQKRDVVAPLSPNAFRIQFTGTRAFRDKLRKAQDLLPRRFRKGELGPVLELALDALIERVEKKRFAVGCKPRRQAVRSEAAVNSRDIPAAIRREVRLRDGDRCTYRDPSGRRCTATSNLEYHHIDGFARVRVHNADRITLMCRTHNQLEAKKMYGRQFMKRARASAAATRSRTSSRSRKPARSKPLLL